MQRACATTVNHRAARPIHSRGVAYPGRGLGVGANFRIGSELGIARGLFVSDVCDEVVEQIANRAEVGVLGAIAGGSSGVGRALLIREPLLGGLIVELLFRNDPVGEACLGGCHEGDCQQKSKCGL